MYRSFRRLLTLENVEGEIYTEKQLEKIRLKRLVYIFLFTILYISCLLLQHGYYKSSPITNQIRAKIFASETEQMNRLQDQYPTPEIDIQMPGVVVADLLNVLQASCRSKSLIEDEMNEFFNCDIIKIDWNRTHQNPSHPELPCDYISLEEYIEKGDNTPWGDFPDSIKNFYEINKVPEEHRAKSHFYLFHKSKLLSPLFDSEHDPSPGPISEINRKLNLIGKEIISKSDSQNLNQIDIFNSNKTRPTSEANFDFSKPKPQNPLIKKIHKNEHLSVNKNHHWDLLLKCDPEWISVTFEVTAVQNERHPMWWKANLKFFRNAPYLNHYIPQLEITTGLAYQKHYKITTLLPLITIIIFILLFLQGPLSSLLMLPYNIHRLYVKKSTLKEIVGHIIDPPGNRVNKIRWFQILLENVFGIMALYSFILSFYSIYTGADSCIEIAQNSCISPFSYWSDSLHLNTIEYLGQILFSLWVKSTQHAIATMFLFIRLLEVSLFFKSTSFLLMTFVFAFIPFIHFSFIFLVLLFAFSILIHAMYGAVYVQFQSISSSFYSLFLYAFGSPFTAAENGVFAYFEVSAYGVAIMLLLFQVFFITILLNMFTTIIMNSYSIAIKNSENPMKMQKVTANIWYRTMLFLGFNDELQDELDTIKRINTVFNHSSEDSMILDMALHLPSDTEAIDNKNNDETTTLIKK